MKKIIYTFVFLSVSLLLFSSCGKAVEPDSTSVNEQHTYKMVLVSEVIPGTVRDSIKLSFRPDSSTWNQNVLNQPFLLLIYKSNGNADQRLVKKQLVGAGGTETFASYNDILLKLTLDSVLVSDSKVATFPSDSSVGGNFSYSSVVIANVSRVGSSSVYEKGFVGVSSISNVVSTGEGLGLSLASGATETAVNPVYFSAVIPKKDVFMIVAHKYSALQPVLSADTILSYSKNSNKDAEIKSGTVLYGYVSKPDTFYIRDPNSKLTLDSSSSDELRLYGYVTLAMGYGRKNVVMQCFNSTGSAVGSLIWDDIAIKASPASVRFDFNLANRDSFFVDEIKKSVCVLSNTIPIVFDSYGDTSLDSNVFIWIATRKAASKFFDDGLFKNDGMTYSSRDTMIWGDCIFETEPEKFTLNSSGKVRERILTGFDYQSGYRISPLAVVKKHDAAGWKSTNFAPAVAIAQASINRSDKAPEVISRLVKKGSILGYDSTTLNSFTVSNVIISHPDSLAGIGTALSWFKTIPFSTFQNNSYSSVQEYLSAIKQGFTGDADKIFNSLSLAYSIDYLNNLYRHPFRGIPVTSSAVSEGEKEFIVIVLAKGKYFGENRVYYSSSTFNYSLVWDAIPPQIKWSVNDLKDNFPYYSPLQTFKYAPMCYRDPKSPSANKCTDFSQLKSGLFDVYLSTIPPLDKECSIRDVGFGKIKSVKLMFNYSSEFISSDPLTGIRKYLSPDYVIELPADVISKQKKETYYDANKKPKGSSYALYDIAFRNIDFSSWRSGLWDMWLQTEDDLGNVGLAPYASAISLVKGEASIRQIEIK